MYHRQAPSLNFLIGYCKGHNSQTLTFLQGFVEGPRQVQEVSHKRFCTDKNHYEVYDAVKLFLNVSLILKRRKKGPCNRRTMKCVIE